MVSVPVSFARAIAQLGDPDIVKVLVKSLAITLAIFAALAFAGGFALNRLFDRTTIAFDDGMGWVLSLLLTILAGWLLFRIVALAVLQFFADEIVLAVEQRFYPQAAITRRSIPLREEAVLSIRATLRAIIVNLMALPFALALLVTGAGTALLFWAVNGWLLGRELQDMVWLRHRSDPALPAPLAAHQRFLLGGAIAAMMAVPVFGLLAPVIGAVSATHLVHSRRTTA